MRTLPSSELPRRELRIAFSILCFVGCALVVVLWVPSDCWRAQVYGGIRTYHVLATSLDGRLRLAVSRRGGWPDGTALYWCRLSKEEECKTDAKRDQKTQNVQNV
jgi:hypothetical protein